MRSVLRTLSLESAEALSISLMQRVASVGVAGMLAIAFVTALDVFLRSVVGTTLLGLNEIVSLGLAVAVAACLPAGLAQRINLSLEVFVPAMPASLSRWLFACGAMLMLGFFILVAWRIGVVGEELAGRGQTTMILRWPQAPFIFAVTGLLCICIPVQVLVVVAQCREALRLTPAAGPFILAIVGLVFVLTLVMLLGGLPSLAGLFGALVSSDRTTVALVFFAGMWGAMLLLVPLSAAMGLAGLFGLAALLNTDAAASVLGSEATKFLTSETLAVLPMFLMMGSFATVAGLSSDIYRFAFELLKPLRGGLAHATIVGCAGFGALTGSSLATAATFGKIALPEMQKRGYSDALSCGAVAAGGTLGSLVPPSTALIIYALLVEQSIGKLFIAAMIPALIAVVLYMITIAIVVRLRPQAAPQGEPIDWRAVRTSLVNCWGAFLLFGLVLGGIYSGIFTDTEAASIGAGGAFLFALFRGKLRGNQFWNVMAEVTGTIALIYTLIFGAVTFSFFIAFTAVPATFADYIGSLGLAPITVIVLLICAYLVLGMVMDSYAMMVITVPIFVPIIMHLGYDPIWWGVLTLICVEDGMISPPFGLNIFVLKGVAAHVKLTTIYEGCWPFVLADVGKIALVIGLPELALWLPKNM